MNYPTNKLAPFFVAAATLAYPLDQTQLNKGNFQLGYGVPSSENESHPFTKDYSEAGSLVASRIKEKLFHGYTAKWKKETARDSSLTRILNNVNYLKIIALGDDVIPYILQDLKGGVSPWFLALRVLADNDEVGSEHPGDFKKMAEAWIEWGKTEGHI